MFGSRWKVAARYLLAAGGCALVAVIATWAMPWLDLPDVVLLFLLGVAVAAWRLGRGPALLAAFLSVGLFDYFFVPPRLTFAVAEIRQLVTFGVLLAVGLIIGQLTANLRAERNAGLRRERWLRALYELARELTAALRVEQIVDIGSRAIAASFGARALILLGDDAGKVQVPDEPEPAVDPAAAQFTFDYGAPRGGADEPLYLPLRAPMRTRGVLVFFAGREEPLAHDARLQLDSFVALIATALERVHYIEVAQNAMVRVESERLRNSVLAALSHDLRTPLTALVGTAESLLRGRTALSGGQAELAASMRDQAYRMNSMVENLLDMARLEAGAVTPNRRWQPIEEVIGSALRARAPLLEGREVRLSLAPDLPPLQLDALLLERVLVNLLENAVKYTPAGSAIEIAARREGKEAVLCVIDEGPGLVPGSEEAIFAKFARGARESNRRGLGLGLAICRTIVEAHGGRIRAENRTGRGARFCFTLPLGTPPPGCDPSDGDGELPSG